MQGSEQTPKAPLGNNARPLQPLHHRTVRTNIDFQNSKVTNILSRQLFLYFYLHNFYILHVFVYIYFFKTIFLDFVYIMHLNVNMFVIVWCTPD